MLTAAHMTELGIAGAAGIGLLTALHPCPLSTLAAAIMLAFAPEQRAFRNVGRVAAIVSGMVFAYAALGFVIGHEILRIPFLSSILPDIVRPFIAPLLIVAGILQTGLFAHSRSKAGSSVLKHLRDTTWSVPGLFFIGAAMALAFCSATAGLYFGVLIPMAIAHQRPALFAAAFAIGYAVPLVAVTIALLAGARLEAMRRRADRCTALSGWALVGIGTYLTLRLL